MYLKIVNLAGPMKMASVGQFLYRYALARLTLIWALFLAMVLADVNQWTVCLRTTKNF